MIHFFIIGLIEENEETNTAQVGSEDQTESIWKEISDSLAENSFLNGSVLFTRYFEDL